MPKDLIPVAWVQKPCLFRQKSSECCELCEQPFTLLNSSRHCTYCGQMFHRKHCSSRNGLGTRRACSHCNDYRTHIREKLSIGEEFVCVGESQEVRVSVCEETAELVFYWTAFNLKETVDLLQVELRKGFTRSGYLLNGDYEPLKSMSLVIKNSKVLSLKSSSAWTCQLWVDGLKSAQYVYRCMLQQEKTRLSYLDRGVRVRSCWFTNYYLVADDPTPLGITPVTPNTATHPTGSASSQLIPSQFRHLSSADSGYSSDRLSTTHPQEVKGHRGSSPVGLFMSYPHSTRPHTQHSYIRHSFPHSTQPWQSHPHIAHSPHRLPYRHSPLSELCRCHNYEIIPSRSVDVCGGDGSPPSTGPRCCGECVDTCRIAQDLDNL